MNAQATGQAVQYLRRSVERDKGADKDRGAGQKRANAEQAARDGVTIVNTFDADWGTSGGREHRDERTAMAAMIEDIRAGKVSRVYCHTADRLARDVEYGMTLWNACADAGTIIRPGALTFDPREPGYLTHWGVLLSQAQEDLERITRKNVDTVGWLGDHAAACKLPPRPHKGRCHLIGCTDTTHCRYAHRSGHSTYGMEPGEDTAAIVAAYRKTGTMMGAARILNDAKVPTRTGGPWSGTSVRQNLLRLGTIPRSTRPGAKSRAPFILYGLLRCHCGHVLTGTRYRNGPQLAYTAYRCYVARATSGHGPSSIPESVVLPWVKEEAARLRVPIDVVELATDNAARRAALAGRLERAHDLYIAGGIDKARHDREAAAVAKERAALDATEVAIEVPDIDWTWPPERINLALRALWHQIDLDHEMRPASFAWTVPEWRSPN